MALDLQTAEFYIPDRVVGVEWYATDLSSQVASLPDEIKDPLLAAGVMFSRPDTAQPGKIYVTDKMSDDMQGLSALHEHLCQGEAVAPCADVERTVLDIMTDEQTAQYLSLRLPMFVAICKLYPNAPAFAETRDMLLKLSA